MRRLASPAWLLRHVIMVALVMTFLRLGWWQFTRAEGGNGLSIGYTLEWPAFAVFVVFVWWREVRITLGSTASGQPPASGAHPESAAQDDSAIPGVARFDLDAARAERAALMRSADTPADSGYNRYLAWLAEHPEAKPGDFRSKIFTEGARAHE